MNYDEKCQVLIIGDSTVGKTSILSRYTNGTFNPNYLATVGLDNFSQDEILDNKTIRIKIWDTAGQERYKSLTQGFFRNAQGIIIVYDVTNGETYENLTYWIQSLKNHMESEIDKIPVIIIGNKIDAEEREVKYEEAELFAKKHNYPYFETSAKNGQNINESIRYLVKEIINKNKGGDKNNDNIKLDSTDGNQSGENSNCAC